jgi:hypothetical protein
LINKSAALALWSPDRQDHEKMGHAEKSIEKEKKGSHLNTIRLTVRCELVEPPAIYQEPFDKLRENGIVHN